MMRRYITAKADRNGFSLVEVLLVVAIGLIVTTISLPRMNIVIANMKLRSSMTSVSGLLQNARAMAVQQNKTMVARHFNRTAIPFSLVYYVKLATDGSAMVARDPQIEMEAPITPHPTPTGIGAPPAITNAAMGLIANPVTTDPSFNTRGLPCAYSGGSCVSNAFIQYFKDDRISGSGGWAAISITPAGRIKRWFWNGSSWID
jgi:prepilin-type N-terminal cleavage/methylation domain-containing protein